MHGFTWVRIDRTTDRTAPLKKLARACDESELYALGLVVRLKLTMAGRFPEGIALLTEEDLALELDVPDEAVRSLIKTGYLQAVQGGLAFTGWQDDPAVRDLLARRKRASKSGSGQEACLTQTGSLPTVDRQPVGNTEQNSTEQNRTVQNSNDEATIYQSELAAVVLAAWPADKRCNPRQVIVAIRQSQATPDSHTCRKIAESAKAWADAYREQGRLQYLPRLDNWISSGNWREPAPADQPATVRRGRTKNGDIALTHDDMTVIINQMKAAEAASQNTKGLDNEQFPF